jgi:hypothetical protein
MELFLLLFIAIRRRRRRRKKAPNSGPTPGDRDLHPSKHIEEEEGLRRCSCVISFRPFLAWLTFKCLKTLFLLYTGTAQQSTRIINFWRKSWDVRVLEKKKKKNLEMGTTYDDEKLFFSSAEDRERERKSSGRGFRTLLLLSYTQYIERFLDTLTVNERW